ncbi:MAG: hypothetical protein KH326_05110, partial [Ruminococcus callidus]|uniref:hypothetical protein n=1 Tax=Ruminococcus callidus TaxID=40519 RepID=UPI0023F526D6
EMKGKTEKILCGFSSIFPKYLGKYARKMRARRYETGSEGKFASRWRAKSPDALCAVLPKETLFPHFSRVFHSTFNNLWKTKTVVFCVSFRIYDKHCTIYGDPAPTPCAKLAGS